MPRGISLHIGVNYEGQDGVVPKLKRAEDSAVAMEQLARESGYQPRHVLLGSAATVCNVKREITAAAQELGEGDTFLLTFAGHGDRRPSSTEADGFDEGWILLPDSADRGTADHSLFDDEICKLLAGFHTGVRIIVVSDSCMSAGIAECETVACPDSASDFRKRPMYSHLPARMAVNRSSASAKTVAPPSIVLIAACGEEEVAFDGVFTEHLRIVWNSGSYRENYYSFVGAIVSSMMQAGVITHSGMTFVGTEDFRHQPPFAISIPEPAALAA